MVSLAIAVLWFGWRTFKRLALIAIVLTFLAVFFVDVEDLKRFIRSPEEVQIEANELLGEAESFLDGVAESLAATPVPTPIVIRYPNDAQLDEATIEQWVVHYTNEERRAGGLVELVHDASVSDFARLHSEQMIQYGYGHTVLGMGPTGRATRAGYECRVLQKDGSISYGVSENIARHPRITKWSGRTGQAVYQLITFYDNSQAIAEGLVKAWMESPGHRKNLMHVQARSIGVGVAILESQQYGWTQEMVYATQNFSRCPESGAILELTRPAGVGYHARRNSREIPMNEP